MKVSPNRKWRPLALLDIDERHIPHDLIIRCRALLGCQPDSVRDAGILYRIRRMRSTAHWHVVIESNGLRLTPAETVALQAILGSHWRREAFNLTRACVLKSAPRVWRTRWNVLYCRQEGDEMGNVVGRGPTRTDGTKPGIEPGDFDAEILVLTVVGKPQRFPGMNGRDRWSIQTKEYPDRLYYCSYQQINALVEHLGNDDNAWDGKQIALEIRMVDNPSKKVDGVPVKVPKWYGIDGARRWQSAIDAYNRHVSGESEEVVDADAAATPKKRGRKASK